jgi:4-hydroxy-2-oxoheptanedioate aldolase
MRTKRTLSLLLSITLAGTPHLLHAQDVPDAWEPTRINKIVELWEAGEPVYYTGCGECDYEAGLRLAQTTADYIDYGMEHSFVDIPRLRDFMRGLVDGGPTPSGHRTPAVIVSTPAVGWTEAAMRANTHLMQYILAAGAHGILLTHAVDPAAIRLMVESIRYPFAPPVEGLGRGMRGAGSAPFAAGIWGISQEEYLRIADPWPLNPEGEILIGLKLENTYALENAEMNLRVPGVAFAEWGPSDMGYWMRGPGGDAIPESDPRMQAARGRVFQATRDTDRMFLNSCNPETVTAMIDEGVMICTGGATETAEIGRRYSNRQMPWQPQGDGGS